ncbi:hypothetical protein [Paenibacillus dendritiformis]|uniref:Uncharacterized protein n=1 Tax=Paenibacillus dendritiformis C454 TaxID=1131935 RepID=H3SJ60_9BACL|nr:hypothetical protein [Paenibacillus dendritiformis]EHQ60896.1 hypothetical protein PDENDC454_17928 [Paenibacillus dendritiformis C454]CAH8771860.1 hypothetical protein H7S4_004595 [Paenibacillus dendritiformis]
MDKTVKWVLLVMFGSFALIVLLTFIFRGTLMGDFLIREWTAQPGKYGEMAVAHLEEKYKEPFTLRSSIYNPVFNGHYEIRATPGKAETPIINVIARETSQGIDTLDDYQIKKRFQPILEKAFPTDRYYFEVTYNASGMKDSYFKEFIKNARMEEIALDIDILALKDKKKNELDLSIDVDKIFEIRNELKREKLNYKIHCYITYFDSAQLDQQSLLQNLYEKDYTHFSIDNEEKRIVSCTIDNYSENYGVDSVEKYCRVRGREFGNG